MSGAAGVLAAQSAAPLAWYRLVELSQLLRELVPPAAGPVVHGVTLLGDPELLIGLLAMLYWNHHREKTVSVVSATFVALVAILALKWTFLAPRPPMAARLVPIEPGGYGFPSGHATAATTVYGGLAISHGWSEDWRKVMGVVAIVVGVALSRVLLGVHYLGDVIAGVALGSVVLALLAAGIRDRPSRGFAASFIISVPALALTGLTPDALLAVGGSLGGIVGVRYLHLVPPIRSTLERVVLSVVGLGYVGVMLALGSLVESVVSAVLLVNVCMVVGIFLVPAAVGTLPDRWVGA
ncbi:phosphatase PAP2 family protein [Haloarculaceae archaeon H-GB2-1]|nr:phosphatase PAP2 family protein [Haloarculaceae archaeon H-GB1-1]MEA5385859.1 phosphatase PAP2 family protein [Haloarculaceae archaeon H-GB11]MEA5407363.1 phosphatase PAP2 family protein [Haloarculaceae archaeon H-GB2-1]